MARTLGDGTVRTALDEPSHILSHIRPPKVILQHREGAVGPWVASAQRSVSRVNQGSALCSCDILQPLWTARRSGRGSIGGGSWIGGPLDGAYKYFLGDDGLRFLTDLFRSMKARESICFDIFETGR